MGRDSVKTKAGRKKGKSGARWMKGQSCVSNPETKKFREEASSQYYHQVKPNPLLTATYLQATGLNDEEIDDDVLSEDIQSITISDGRTFGGASSLASYKTFASNWSKCSNKAFERFLSRFKLDSALHKDMLSILAATSEIINNFGGTHKETEYFASFISALDKCEPEQYHAMLALVAIIVGKIPKAVLRRKFSDFYPKIGSILEEALDSQNLALIRMCCEILRRCLAVQEPSALTDRSVQTQIYSIMKCAIHENPKVRKKARKAISFIIEEQNEMNGEEATFLVIGWILDQLSSYPACGSRTVVDSLSLLQHVWLSIKSVPSTGAKKLFESVLRVMSSGDISILKIGFMFFSTMFQTGSVVFTTSESDNLTFVEGLNAKLVTAIWEFKPNWRNEEIFVCWLQCILNGIVKLSFENLAMCQQYIPLLFDVVSPTWSASFGSIASKILTDVLSHLITPEVSSESIDNCFQILSKNLISLPPNQNCLMVLSKFLETLTPKAYSSTAKEILFQLLPLRTTNGVEGIIGNFVIAFGVANIWTSVDSELQRTVVLPLLRNNISNESFQFWKDNIYSLLKAPNAGSDVPLKSLVWDSFVGFCKNPSDLTNFPAELLGKTIVESPDVRLNTLAALRQLLKWPQAKPIVEKYSKNYLPILFNLYVKEKCLAASKDKSDWQHDGHSEATGTTIQEYLPFCPKEFILELTEKALTKYEISSSDPEKTAVLDLVAFLILNQDNEALVEKVYKVVSTLINDKIHMKRAYRIFVVLLKNEQTSQSIKTSIADLLRENKGKTKSNTQPFRLECLSYLALQNKSWLAEFVPEAILSLLSVNMNARRAAVKFVNVLMDNIKETGESLDKLMTIVNIGLQSPQTFTCACTIHFLTVSYRLLELEDPSPALINQCIKYINEKSGTIIANEAFRFLSLNLTLFKSKMGPFASGIGAVLVKGELPRKETNKMLARLIKIFGIVGIKAIIPNSTEPKMHRRIKNIQKKLRKLKDAKRQNLEKEERELSDDEAYTDEVIDSWTGASRSSKPSEKLLIKEDLVDFLDPHNMSAAIISKPKEPKRKEDEFKLSSDGKLIIQESKASAEGIEDDDDEEEFNELFKKPEVGKKRKINSSSSIISSSTKRSSKRSCASVSSRGSYKSTKSLNSRASSSNKPNQGFGKSNSKRRKFSTSSSKSYRK